MPIDEGEQLGMLGVPGKHHAQKPTYKYAQMGFKTYEDYLMHMELTTPGKVADYWDAHLEQDMMPYTTAGAFLAVMIESAGDIIRELGKGPGLHKPTDLRDFNYIAEKYSRIKRERTSEGWKEPLSPKDRQHLELIIESLVDLPAPTQMYQVIKQLLQRITLRDTVAMKPLLEKLGLHIEAEYKKVYGKEAIWQPRLK